ncbi:MAG TPA: hypothetical protein VGU20_14975 [Stellaceae bacterium]|nr:hypothetical protein [Stellaceae bacterium]
MNPRYVQFYLRWQNNRILSECSKDGTTVSSIEFPRFASFPIPLSPPAEQKRIAARIQELFGEIEAGEQDLEKAREALETYRRAVLKSAVTGQLTKGWRQKKSADDVHYGLLQVRDEISKHRSALTKGTRLRSDPGAPLDPAKLPPVPETWAWAKLEELIVEGPTNGYSPKASQNQSGTLALKLTATTAGSLNLSSSAIKRLSEHIPACSSLFLEPGDVLFQRGNTREYVGIAAVYDGPRDTYVYPDLMIRVRTVTDLMAAWIWRVSNSFIGRGHMQRYAVGTAGTMPKINGDVVRNLPIPVPPREEMSEALKMLSDALVAIDDLESEIAKAETAVSALRQSTLESAFEGGLVPQNPGDEAASTLLARIRASGTNLTFGILSARVRSMG